MKRATARPDAVSEPTNADQAMNTGERRTANMSSRKDRRATSGVAALLAGAFADNGFAGSTTFGGVGTPSDDERIALIISAGDIPGATVFTSVFATGAEATGPAAGAAANAAPDFARIAAMISAGLFAAPAVAAGVATEAAATGFLIAARILAVPAGTAAGFGVAGAAAAAFGTSANGCPGVDSAGGSVADAAAAFLARIFERMSFVEGFGSVIQPCQTTERIWWFRNQSRQWNTT